MKDIQALIDFFSDIKEIKEVIYDIINNKRPRFYVKGSALSLFLSSLSLKGKVIYLTKKETDILNSELKMLNKDRYIYVNENNLSQACLFQEKDKKIMLVDEQLFKKINLTLNTLKICSNQKIERKILIDFVIENFYTTVDIVFIEKEVSFRGNIVDIFPPGYNFPVRIDFMDDFVEKISFFEPLTQKRIKHINCITIYPAEIKENNKSRVEFNYYLSNRDFFIDSKSLNDLGIAYPDENLKLAQDFTIFNGTGNFLENTIEIPHIENTFVFLKSKIAFLGSKRKKTKNTSLTKSTNNYYPLAKGFKKGDYIVYEDYGVGRFEGIKNLNIGDIKKDFVLIKYAHDDSVLLPLENLDRIDKYIGEQATVDSLRNNEWRKILKKARKYANEYAKLLYETYKKRFSTKRIPYGKAYKELEIIDKNFPYTLTLDQEKVLEEIFDDMNKDVPMDRLLTGDAGIGKTEIALRTAVRAVFSLRQVVFLVPTTLLAIQHYELFKYRLQKLGINIEILSRFSSNRTKIFNKLKDGYVDILIATHSVLNKEITFKNLGLLIIDEEQKFGVLQKEFFKRQRSSIDILSLSATPIPRSLYMSLSNLKEISIIQSPPPGRKDIYTEIIHWQDKKIKYFVKKEIKRGGTVLFIHNRINDILKIKIKLENILHEEIRVAHSKIGEKKLIKIFKDFREKRFKILLSTAIMESGIDIPHLNTVIVNRADMFGLSDLHQIRGRVGRGNVHGYAVFIIPKKINEIAQKRIETIKKYTNIGAGYIISIKDLELRGAGNLLGIKQHGPINRVGVYLYTKLLKEAILELNEERTLVPEIKIDTEAYIPKWYIKSEQERIAIYKKILSAQNLRDLKIIESEIEDKNGAIPLEMKGLIEISTIKILSTKKKISSVIYSKNILKIKKNGIIETFKNVKSPEIVKFISYI